MAPWLRARAGRVALVLVLVAALGFGLGYRSWVAAQARAVVVVATTLQTPVLAWTVAQLTGEPRAAETILAGVPSTVVRPGGDGPWPAFIFVNGATVLGRKHPDVQRLARGLARAGYLTVVPDIPGLARGELTPASVATTVRLSEIVAARPDSTGRVALFGVSLGATIALLAAEDPQLTSSVSVVVGIAPYTDFESVLRLATTGYTTERGRLVFYGPGPYLSLAVARSLAAALPESSERDRLARLLERVPDDSPEPLAELASFTSKDMAVAAAVALLTNRDPARFDALYARLPADVRARVVSLSPVSAAGILTMPVELASAPRDPYIPLSESRNLARLLPHARMTVTGAFAHVIPQPSLTDLCDLGAFDAWAVRSLHAARR
jgi:pimeloyl-ACP methyl ester carboxylesterase